MTEIEALIIRTIYEQQGIKATQLCAIPEIALGGDDDFCLPTTLEKLVKAGRILEIEYIVPQLPKRIKSFYFAPGTRWRSANTEEWLGK